MDSDIFFNFIKDSDMKSMKSMINNGYNINTLSKDGKSPIEYSIDLLEFSTNKQANLNIIKFLIESGVTIRENKESIINAIFKYIYTHTCYIWCGVEFIYIVSFQSLPLHVYIYNESNLYIVKNTKNSHSCYNLFIYPFISKN